MAITKESVIKYIKKNGIDNVQIDYQEFLNTKVHGFHKSRYIASWAKYNGKIDHNFYEWLLTIPFDDGTMSEEEADEIYRFATCGKLEFESSAIRYKKQMNANAN